MNIEIQKKTILRLCYTHDARSKHGSTFCSNIFFMLKLFKHKNVINSVYDGIWIIKGLLSETDCLNEIKKIESIGFNKARQYEKGRQNKEAFNSDNIILKILQSRFDNTFLVDTNRKIKVKELSKPLEFYKYEQGDFIKRHSDAGRVMSLGKMSSLTLVLYLNDNYIGGETFFEEKNIKIKPKIGSGLLFQREIEHESLIIEYGIKYVLRADCLT